MMIVLAACVIGGLSVALCLSQVLDADHLRGVRHRVRLRQFTIGQMMGAIVVAALLFHIAAARGPEVMLSMALLVLGALIGFVGAWQREFVFLMGLRDADFPGRHDKVIWATLLLALAPIGVWFFRAYRLAHWPAPAPAIDPGRRTEAAGGPATHPA